MFRSHLITCNCNHFVADLAVRLGAAPVPGWVNRLAAIGACLLWWVPQSLTGAAPVVGDTNPSSASRSAPAPTFSGAGRSLREVSSEERTPLLQAGLSRAEMRERAVQAALARERSLKQPAE